jgi:large subunit ribosomal protein L15
MMIHEITGKVGKHKERQRVGRGTGSGKGKTCGRGHKGQKARAGSKQNPLRQGGAIPFYRQLPIRGFSNVNFTAVYQLVNVADLERSFESGAEVDAETLAAAGLIRSARGRVKILGNGSLSKKLNVTADKFSGSAKAKIEEAGGAAVEIPPPAPKPKGPGKKRKKVAETAAEQDPEAEAAEATETDAQPQAEDKPETESAETPETEATEDAQEEDTEKDA